jgi:hypothetical protein
MPIEENSVNVPFLKSEKSDKKVEKSGNDAISGMINVCPN